MSIVTCAICETDWAASVRPRCPVCLVAHWLASPHLLTEKHDPRGLSRVHHEYRSVVSEEVIRNLRAFLDAAAEEGTWYYNVEYEKFNHVTRLPLDHKPGAGVRAGSARPDRHLEDLVIADADRDPHLFVDGRDETRRKIASGVYRRLDTCRRTGCDNLAHPGARECAIHVDPPRATRGLR